MAYQDQFTNASSPNFIGRISIAAMNQVAVVAGESATGVTNHSARASFAKAFLQTPMQFAPQMAMAVAAILGLDSLAAVTDAQLLAAVGNIWNAFAGAI